MSREKPNLTRRLARLEGHRGGDICICANPVRVTWTGEVENVEPRCPDCGGELIVAVWAFDPRGVTPAAQRKLDAKLEKAAPAIAKAVNPDGTRDWSRLTDEELAEAHDAFEAAAKASAPKEKGSPKAWRSKQSREDMSILDMEF